MTPEERVRQAFMSHAEHGDEEIADLGNGVFCCRLCLEAYAAEIRAERLAAESEAYERAAKMVQHKTCANQRCEHPMCFDDRKLADRIRSLSTQAAKGEGT